MVKYTIERLLLAFVTAAIILTLTYFMMKQLPFQMPIGGDEVKFAYFQKELNLGNVLRFTSEQNGYGDLLIKLSSKTERKVTYYYYKAPAYIGYFRWVSSIFTQGNWGTSVAVMQNVDAMVIIMKRMPTTIKVNIWPAVISVPAGIGLGVWAALKKNKLTDHIISTLVMIFISVPSFIVITFLMLLLCFNNRILPTQWPNADAPMGTKVLGYFIPTMALSFGSICGYCRFTRAELTEVMSSDFLLLARTKGLTKSQAITRHAMKNAMVPILPSVLAEIIGLLGGSMILEQIYGIPGVGSLYVKSINANDYNVLMADMALYTIIGLVSGVFLDLSYGFIDPRIRMGAKK